MTQCERILRHLRDYGSITLRTGATARYAPPLLRSAQAAAAPGWNPEDSPGLVAPAEGSGATAISASAGSAGLASKGCARAGRACAKAQRRDCYEAEAQAEYGVARLAARIDNLRERGHVIRSELVQGRNRYGEKTRYARYTLERENGGK